MTSCALRLQRKWSELEQAAEGVIALLPDVKPEACYETRPRAWAADRAHLGERTRAINEVTKLLAENSGIPGPW